MVRTKRRLAIFEMLERSAHATCQNSVGYESQTHTHTHIPDIRVFRHLFLRGRHALFGSSFFSLVWTQVWADNVANLDLKLVYALSGLTALRVLTLLTCEQWNIRYKWLKQCVSTAKQYLRTLSTHTHTHCHFWYFCTVSIWFSIVRYVQPCAVCTMHRTKHTHRHTRRVECQLVFCFFLFHKFVCSSRWIATVTKIRKH